MSSKKILHKLPSQSQKSFLQKKKMQKETTDIFLQHYDIEKCPLVGQELELLQKNTFIGKKQYAIMLHALPKTELDFLRNCLLLIPNVFSPYPINKEKIGIPIYRETETAIYIPKEFGLKRYGKPFGNLLREDKTQKINLQFTWDLREYQKKVFDAFVEHFDVCRNYGGILQIPCGKGKTILAIRMLVHLGVKTLIVVPTEDLMEQWEMVLQSCCPTVQVGKIQGSVFDVENKDVVVGTIQTLYGKEFEAGSFDNFGLAILDEVHHWTGKEYSNFFYNIPCKKIIGLSATLYKTKNLFPILQYSIGSVFFSDTSRDGEEICIRAIHYDNKDPFYNEIETDDSGNPSYSKMITKISNYKPRTLFLIKALKDAYHEHPENQIMVLANNKSLLYDLNEELEKDPFATFGYYMGQMKKHNKLESKNKNIILGTYAMASEGLDIKTLATLFMVSPRVDITQSVGRILREKHDHYIVYDIVDNHRIFKGQFVKRKDFYKKFFYDIYETKASQYYGVGNSDDWNADLPQGWKCTYTRPQNNSAGINDEEDDAEFREKTNVDLECMF
jgi:hypothetical protein